MRLYFVVFKISYEWQNDFNMRQIVYFVYFLCVHIFWNGNYIYKEIIFLRYCCEWCLWLAFSLSVRRRGRTWWGSLCVFLFVCLIPGIGHQKRLILWVFVKFKTENVDLCWCVAQEHWVWESYVTHVIVLGHFVINYHLRSRFISKSQLVSNLMFNVVEWHFRSNVKWFIYKEDHFEHQQ